MPTSDYHQISDVLHVVDQIRPANTLDVGVGFGKFGYLLREILEVYEGRESRDKWTRQIDGIEIHAAYKNPVWDFAYDRILLKDAREAVTTLDRRYDLILCCDVIEHFTKEEGQRFLQNLLAAGNYVLITSPRGYSEQGAAFGNKHEEHKSGWTKKDFAGTPHLYKDVGFTFIALLSNEEELLSGVSLLNFFRVRGLKRSAVDWCEAAFRRLLRREPR